MRCAARVGDYFCELGAATVIIMLHLRSVPVISSSRYKVIAFNKAEMYHQNARSKERG